MLLIYNTKPFNDVFMKHNTKGSKESLPPELRIGLAKLGENIRTARKRRQWTIQEMASRMFVIRQTLSRLERGDAGATLSVLVSALWILGLEKQLFQLAAPENDKVGIFLEKKHQPERVRKPSFREKADF
ncbi:MAG TPA: transcriptional regulator [Lentisphaeria bacterium]|nr:transcriptional regulator [Lentisphaeria bacterium]